MCMRSNSFVIGNAGVPSSKYLVSYNVNSCVWLHFGHLTFIIFGSSDCWLAFFLNNPTMSSSLNFLLQLRHCDKNYAQQREEPLDRGSSNCLLCFVLYKQCLCTAAGTCYMENIAKFILFEGTGTAASAKLPSTGALESFNSLRATVKAVNSDCLFYTRDIANRIGHICASMFIIQCYTSLLRLLP